MLRQSPPRQFLVDSLPEFFWILEQEITLICWELGSGWRIEVTELNGALGTSTSVHVRGSGAQAVSGEYALTPRSADTLTAPEAVVDALFAAHPTARAKKTRRGCMLDGVWWIIDEFHEKHEGLLLAATPAVADRPATPAEANRAATARGRRPAGSATTGGAPKRRPVPAWVGAEVTGDAAYDDHALAHSAG